MATSRNSRAEQPRSFSQLANEIEHASDEYDYFKSNEFFANEYVNSFIDILLENEIIPDLLILLLNEMNAEDSDDDMLEGPILPSDYYIRNTISNNVQPMRLGFDGNELVSDNLLHNFIRLPTDNRKKLSPYVISPVQRKESISYSRHKTQTSDIMTIESPKPLKEYKVADTRSLMSRNSLKPIVNINSSRNSIDLRREKSNLSFYTNSNKTPDLAVLNGLTEDFISKSIRQDFMPRLAIDTIESAESERKQKNFSYYSNNESVYDQSYDPNSAKELLNSAQLKLSDLKKNNEDFRLFSTDFLHDLEYNNTNSRFKSNNNTSNKGRINDRFVLAPIDTKYNGNGYGSGKNKTNSIKDLFSTDFLDSFELTTKPTSKNRLRKF